MALNQNRQFKSRVYLNILHFISSQRFHRMYFHVNFSIDKKIRASRSYRCQLLRPTFVVSSIIYHIDFSINMYYLFFEIHSTLAHIARMCFHLKNGHATDILTNKQS